MRTITFSLPAHEQKQIQVNMLISIKKSIAAANNRPHKMHTHTIESYPESFDDRAAQFAMFEQLKTDGLVDILKERDECMSPKDLHGDMFCPTTNPDTPEKQLMLERKRHDARCYKQGIHVMTLVVIGDEIDSVGGFIGNDFYNSGYDTDFYRDAIERVKNSYPEYISQILSACSK